MGLQCEVYMWKLAFDDAVLIELAPDRFEEPNSLREPGNGSAWMHTHEGYSRCEK